MQSYDFKAKYGGNKTVSIKKHTVFYEKIKKKENLHVFKQFLFLFLSFYYKIGLGYLNNDVVNVF